MGGYRGISPGVREGKGVWRRPKARPARSARLAQVDTRSARSAALFFGLRGNEHIVSSRLPDFVQHRHESVKRRGAVHPQFHRSFRMRGQQTGQFVQRNGFVAPMKIPSRFTARINRS